MQNVSRSSWKLRSHERRVTFKFIQKDLKKKKYILLDRYILNLHNEKID